MIAIDHCDFWFANAALRCCGCGTYAISTALPGSSQSTLSTAEGGCPLNFVFNDKHIFWMLHDRCLARTSHLARRSTVQHVAKALHKRPPICDQPAEPLLTSTRVSQWVVQIIPKLNRGEVNSQIALARCWFCLTFKRPHIDAHVLQHARHSQTRTSFWACAIAAQLPAWLPQ